MRLTTMDTLNLRRKQLPKPPPSTPPIHRPSPTRPKAPLQSPTGHDIRWTVRGTEYMTTSRMLQLVAAVVILSIILFYFERSVLAVITLAVFVATLVTIRHQPHTPLTITLNDAGILLNQKPYYFRVIKSFWIFYEPGGTKELSLQLNKWYMPYLRIPLNNQDPLAIRGLLIRYVPEEEHTTSLVDAWLSGR